MADIQGQASTAQSTTPPTNPVETKTCTVRGCSNEFPAFLRTKMCESCRGKHRIYATTKRAKRRLEKAAINGIILETADQPGQLTWSFGSGENNLSSPPENKTRAKPTPTTSKPAATSLTPAPNSLVDSQPTASTSTSPVHPFPFPPPGSFQAQPLVPWDLTNIDPQLFKAQSSSHSSELAGALGPSPVPPYVHAVPTHVVTPVNETAGAAESQTSVQSVIESTATSPSESTITAVDAPVDTSTSGTHTSNGTRRYCTIRGCRVVLAGAIIFSVPVALLRPLYQGDYPFKMCEPCRVRHRQYGITKRAKFRAERAAFDKELADLRAAEDARRKEQGLAVCKLFALLFCINF
jgi:hypothetical protein